MREIRGKAGFSPCATWLVARGHAGVEVRHATLHGGGLEWCATIQGVVDAEGVGSIQNVGVVPAHRGLGLGSSLIEQTLSGFQKLGLRRAYLEVTADNNRAVRLYQRLGFRTVRTIYKMVDSPLRFPVDQFGHRGEPALS